MSKHTDEFLQFAEPVTDRIDGEPMEFEWNIFPGFNTLQLSKEVKSLLLRLDETPENFHWTDHLHVDVQRHLMEI